MIKTSKLLVAIAIVAGTLGCGFSPEVTADNSRAKSKAKHSHSLEFEQRDRVASRLLRIDRVDDHKIKFDLTIKDHHGGSSNIHGVAISGLGDPEILEDPEGNVYAADEYIYDGDCWLSIKIETDRQQKAMIKESGCEKKRKLNHSFGSESLFDRK